MKRALRAAPRWARTRVSARAVVLMYHGIGDVGIDPWGLFVSASNFDEHLQVLEATARPLPLGDLGRACEVRAVPRRAVAVTFDDGYVNVLQEANPLLEAHSIPATLFAISEPMRDGSEPWWDALAAAILTPGVVPDVLELATLDGAEPVEVGAAVTYTGDQWRADHRYRDEEGPAGPRMQLYRTLWARLLRLDDRRRQEALHEITEWAGGETPRRETHRCMSLAELAELDGDGMEVGGHTVTHPLLPELSPGRQANEIGDNKRDIETALGHPIELFSYPFGAHDRASATAASAAGYRLAVTARAETAAAGVDPHRIGRFDVKDWSGEEFERRLDRWMRYR